MTDHRARRPFAGLSRVRLLAVPLAIVLALAGCAGQPGAAAIVDGEVISEAYLAETVADLSVFSDAPPASVLQALIVAPFWVDGAAEAGYGASDDEAEALLADLAASNGVSPSTVEAGPGLLSIARVTAAQDKANASGEGTAVAGVVQERVNDAEIVVNPRYGEWVLDQGVQSVPRPWLTTG